MLFQIVYRFTPKFGMLDKYFWQITNFNTSNKYFCQNLKLGLKNRWNARWNPYWNDAEWLRLMELWASQKGNFLSSRPILFKMANLCLQTYRWQPQPAWIPDGPCRIFHGSSKNEMKGQWLDIVRLGLSNLYQDMPLALGAAVSRVCEILRSLRRYRKVYWMSKTDSRFRLWRVTPGT